MSLVFEDGMSDKGQGADVAAVKELSRMAGCSSGEALLLQKQNSSCVAMMHHVIRNEGVRVWAASLHNIILTKSQAYY